MASFLERKEGGRQNEFVLGVVTCTARILEVVVKPSTRLLF